MGRMNHVRSVSAILVVLAALLSPAPAGALQYGVTARGVTDGGANLSCDGNTVYAWVYGLEPWHVVYVEKVNSIYAFNVYEDVVEVGIDWPSPPLNPQAFTVNAGGPLGYQERWLELYPAKGTWVSLMLKRYTDVDPNSFDWSYYFAGSRRGTWSDTGMRSAMIQWGCERTSLLDNGNLSFQTVRYMPYRGAVWQYVPHAIVDPAYQNNDPAYHWDFSQIDSASHKIMVQHN